MIPGCCAVPLECNLISKQPFFPFKKKKKSELSISQVHLRYSVRFPAACRTICENGSIISIQHAIQEIFGRRLVYIRLGRILIKDPIKRECLVLDPLALLRDYRFGESLHGIILWRIEHSIGNIAHQQLLHTELESKQ